MQKNSTNKHPVGYACMHYEKRNGERLTTGRTVRKATALSNPEKVHIATKENLMNLYKMVQFNAENRIKCLRTSLIFPWYDLIPPETYSKWDETLELAKSVGELASKNGIRITAHPSHFVCLGSPNEGVVENSIIELEAHAKMFDIIGLPQDPTSKINIHVGGTYGGDFKGTAKRFCENFKRLSETVQKRLTVENDDKINGWGVQELLDYVHLEIGVPIVFDSLHWEHGPKSEGINKDYFKSLDTAIRTWHHSITPMVHHSQSALTEREGVRATAHSDSYTLPFVGSQRVDIMLECKKKEVACLDYITKFLEINDK
jgi:UV DNA damage endonuclease